MLFGARCRAIGGGRPVVADGVQSQRVVGALGRLDERERDLPEVVEFGLALASDGHRRPVIDDERRLVGRRQFVLADVGFAEAGGRLPVDAGELIAGRVLPDLVGFDPGPRFAGLVLPVARGELSSALADMEVSRRAWPDLDRSCAPIRERTREEGLRVSKVESVGSDLLAPGDAALDLERAFGGVPSCGKYQRGESGGVHTGWEFRGDGDVDQYWVREP